MEDYIAKYFEEELAGYGEEARVQHVTKWSGDRMTIAEYAASVDDGSLTDYDGWGYAGYENQDSNIMVHPSTVEAFLEALAGMDEKFRFTHIYWCNK